MCLNNLIVMFSADSADPCPIFMDGSENQDIDWKQTAQELHTEGFLSTHFNTISAWP